jgi:membrane peptidoglycan carboxypeptidase
MRMRNRRRRDRNVFVNVIALLLCSGLAGVIVAALVFPVVAMGALTARSGADTFEGLPTDVDVLPSPQISYAYASDGVTPLVQFYDENRHDVPITQVADVMRKAVVAAEDARFYEHNGVDLKGIARAFVNNQQGGDTQGASTLTMQLVRQVISYSAKTPQQVLAVTEDTPERKLAEIKRALALEKTLTKEQILERYMNIAAFGNGAYGIYAASQVYYGKVPADLTLGEAALLAGLPKAPGSYNLTNAKGLEAALARRDNYVLPQMVKLGYATQAQADEAKLAGAPKIIGKRTPEGCTEVAPAAVNGGFFCDYLKRWWEDQPAFGADSYERLNRLQSAGYRIVTTLDLQAQNAAMTNIRKVMDKKKDQHQAMMLAAVEPGSGRLRALAVNRTFSNDQSGNGPNTNPTKKGLKGNYPNTTVPLMSAGGEVQGYQVGSAMKIFTIVAALEQGLPLSTEIDTVSPYHSKYPVDDDSEAKCPESSYYCPVNSGGKPAGKRNMWTGLGSSINTYFVPLQERIGTEKVVEVAQRMGLVFHNDEDRKLAANAHTWGAFTLGVTDQTPLEMANAFATLAADGKYCKPIPVQEIKTDKGVVIPGAEPSCKQVITPDVARAAIDAARCPVGDESQFGKCEGKATAPDSRRIIRYPIFGKTGTTDDERSATLTISTKQLSVSGFYTDPDYPRTHEKFKHEGGVNPVVQGTLRDAMAGKPAIGFARCSNRLALGT